MSNQSSTLPKIGFAGLVENWKSDLTSGFLVFLIALPLCLGISMASGFPPVAGIFTAAIGGMLVSFFGGSQLTIKGPAAGLIVIALTAVQELGRGDAFKGYTLTLAVIVIAGILQIIFGLLRSGILSDFFPSAAVHGMLAAIGIIIASKQIHTLLGVKPEADTTLQLISAIPKSLQNLNPEIATIGAISLFILFVLPTIRNKYAKRIPAPLVVLLIAIPLGHYFNLEFEHTYLFLGHHEYTIGPKFLVTLPDNLASAITLPDFSQITSPSSIKFILMFALVGSLESLLSTKAIDTLDPWHRKSNMNRDLLGIGVGNTLAGMIGGLPMISEIVRSSANIHSGAKTWWSNVFHGFFLLVFVAFLPELIHQIPLAALAAMLIYTGFRLASPREFYKTYKIGREQLIIFTSTVIVTLLTDLLVGIGVGIVLKLIIHKINGLPTRNIFKPLFSVNQKDEDHYIVDVYHSAVFSNYILLKKSLDSLPKGKTIQIDFSGAQLVDHTVMENLHRYRDEYIHDGGGFELTGLDHLKKFSAHELSARKEQKRGKNHIRALLFSGFIVLTAGSHAQGYRTNNPGYHTWLMGFCNLSVNEHWRLLSEYQWRRDDLGLNWQQSLSRVGIERKLNPNVSGALGYGRIITFPYGENPSPTHVYENRIWEQISFKQTSSRLVVNHRYRLEQRFNKKIAGSRGSDAVRAASVYSNRIRYKFSLSYPISYGNANNEGWFLSFYDEVFLNFGNHAALNIFDQNRLSGALEYRIDSSLQFEFGYLNQYILKPDGHHSENNHTLQAAVFWSPNRPKKTHENG